MEEDKYLMSTIDVYEKISEIQHEVYEMRGQLDTKDLQEIYHILNVSLDDIKHTIARRLQINISQLGKLIKEGEQ